MFPTLWKRKYYYIIGYAIGSSLGTLNIALGQKMELSELLLLPIGTCFLFGFLFYLVFEQRELLKKEGRLLLLSKDG